MIAKSIDHTYLHAGATHRDIAKLCQEASALKFRGVCVNPVWVLAAVNETIDTKIITVIDFPLGASESTIKVVEAILAVKHGADELDVVWNLGHFLEGKFLQTTMELVMIVEQVSPTPVKVIVETGHFTKNADFINAHKIVRDSGAFCIKTCTGYGPRGVTPGDLMRLSCNDGLKIKVSGSITRYGEAKGYLDAGADIIGTSHGVQIVQEETDHADNT